MATKAAAALLLCATGASNAFAAPNDLQSYTPSEVASWLEERNLADQFASQFLEMGFDGDLLVNYLQPSDLEAQEFPRATAAHKRKLFDQISRATPRGKVSHSHHSRRRLDTDSYSGLEIRRDNAAVFLGKDSDVVLMRTGEDTLATDNQMLVQGIDVARASSGLATTDVAWDFSQPGTKNFFRTATDLTLPTHFTIEMWVYPLAQGTGTILSFATDSDVNCMRLMASGFSDINTWHHLVVTYDRHHVTIHENGKVKMEMLDGDYCGDYTGSLVVGQKQEAVGGAFEADFAGSMYVDTVAIYNRVFDETERGNSGKTCVDMTDPSLVSLWSGYTRGQDLVGPNNAEVRSSEFVEGVNGEQSCSVYGYGEGKPGNSYDSYALHQVSPAVGAVGWVFPGQNTKYHFFIEGLTLPLDWSIEFWIYPLKSASGDMFISWASAADNNCMFLSGSKLSTGEWHHFIITWDGEEQQVFVDGQVTSRFTVDAYSFCGDYTGALSIGQEQDTEGGSFDADQAPAMILDTVAIYSRAKSPDEIMKGNSSCIQLASPSLYSLYSGYSQGKDLVGTHDATMTAIEILAPGDSTTVGSTYKWTNVEFDLESCEAAQDQVASRAPSLDSPLVGGIGWDFLGDSEGYYFARNFTLPDEFTIEFWAYPRSQRGYLLSFASEDDNNCLLISNTKFSEYNAWWHIVVTVDSDDVTTVYANGTKTSGWIYGSAFCGDSTGYLVFGQEQDTLKGSFDANQAFDGIIDTVAIYNTAWASTDIESDKPIGVDLAAMDLWALYSGVTRGQDLVGSQNGELWLYQFAEGMPNTNANLNTLDMLSPLSVGGVAWNFPTGSTDYYIHTGNNFRWPDGSFTLEMWVSVHSTSTSKYFLSYATSANDNCMLAQMHGFTSDDVDTWRHFVITYDDDNDATYAYLDGTLNMDFIYGTSQNFCGDRVGSLIIGQEQDSVGGGLSASQAADMAVDTVAIYSSYWSSTKVNAQKGKCLDLKNPTLWTVWSGFTRGKDLIGNNDAIISTEDWYEGASLECA